MTWKEEVFQQRAVLKLLGNQPRNESIYPTEPRGLPTTPTPTPRVAQSADVSSSTVQPILAASPLAQESWTRTLRRAPSRDAHQRLGTPVLGSLVPRGCLPVGLAYDSGDPPGFRCRA